MTLNTRNIKFFKKKIETKESIKNISAFKNQSIGYITSILACTSIPHSKIKNNYFIRKNGKISLKIISDPEYGLPYGLIPRIFLIWLCTEVKLKKSQVIYLGKNQNEFIRKLGITPTGGTNGSINRVKKQIISLFNSTISLVLNKKNTYKFNNLNIFDDGVFFLRKFWTNKVVLSEKFFRKINSTSLPIDLRVIHVLRSPLAIDIYIWLTWRSRMINNLKGVIISWEKLKLQFGSNYSNNPKGIYNFKYEFLKQLKNVCFFYSKVNILILKTGINIRCIVPHIPNCR